MNKFNNDQIFRCLCTYGFVDNALRFRQTGDLEPIPLISLSKITDEHMSMCKDMLCVEDKRDAEYLEGMMRIRFEKGNLYDFFSLFPYYAKYFIQIVDFLRKEGYMIPFEGIDLFEAGIAIEKQ